MTNTIRIVLIGVALVFAVCHGQSFRGQITGVVTDSTGAVIVGANVTAANLATGVEQKVSANEEGIYRLLNLQPGNYRVSAESAGFKTFVQEPITVPVSGNLTLNIPLELGQVTEEVTVTGESPLLEAATASFGQVVSERAIAELPLNVRNPMNLVTLTPGVITSSNFGRDGIANGIEVGRDQYGADFQIGGGRPLANEILLDGAPNSSVDRGYMAYTPPVDSTQEFKIEANAFSAEFGRTTGGVVNIVTKGGGNEVHGTVYNHYRTSKLDANDFFFNRSGQTSKPSWHRNQFGGNIGGPIRRNKTFYFANYEGLRQAVPFTQFSTVPTALQRAGDFSQTRAPNGTLITIYDPDTLQRAANGNPIRTPFAGNRIPISRFDPVAVNITKMFPDSNVAGNAVTNANNHLSTDQGTDGMNNYGGRIDHSIGQANRLFGRFSYRKDSRVAARRFLNAADNNGAPTDKSWNATLSDIHTFGATLTGEFRASFARHHTAEISPSYGFDVTSIGFPRNYAETQRPFFPKVNQPDMQNMGRDRFYNQFRDTVSFQGSVTKLHGRHTMKSGFDLRVPRFYLDRNLNAGGTFSFSRNFTQGPNANQASSTAGFSYASFLLGAGSGGSLDHTGVFTLNRRYHFFYFQDDWKVTSTFTLNLGVNYSFDIGQNESHNRLAIMNLEAPSPIAERVGLPLRGQLQFAGDNFSRNLTRTDRNNWAPRFGFAWQPTSRTAIRGGYGIFYAPVWISAYDINVYAGYNSSTPWVTSLDGLTPLNFLSNPFPQGFNLPTGDRNPLTNTGFGISGWLHNEPVGYTQQWNFTVQRQLSKTMVIEAAYWANKGTKMENRSGWSENQLPNEYLALGNQLNQLVPNPFFGVIESGALSNPTVARRQLLLPYPQYTSVVRTGPSVGNSIYHAFTLRAEKRLSAGFSFLASYTASKSIDDYDARPYDQYNVRLERSVSATDTPQRLVLSSVYDLPFGREKSLGKKWHPVVDGILGGWTLSGIATFQSGQPVGVSRTAISSGKSAKVDNPTIDRWYDRTQFTVAPAFTYGNVGRLLPDVRSDGVSNLDFTVAKYFPFAERYKLKFRADFFNATNTPQFAAPNGSVTGATFTTVNSQFNLPRSIQFAAQLYW